MNDESDCVGQPETGLLKVSVKQLGGDDGRGLVGVGVGRGVAIGVGDGVAVGLGMTVIGTVLISSVPSTRITRNSYSVFSSGQIS